MINQKIDLHWRNVSKSSKLLNSNITYLIEEIMPYLQLVNFNVLLFNQIKVENLLTYNSDNHNDFEKMLNGMIYSKFPERIMYGILRFYTNSSKIKASIYIEEATDYIQIDLAQKLKQQLNEQAIYRGENFLVEECCYKNKQQIIGLEITDILLGIIGNIVESVAYFEPNIKPSNTRLAKEKIILDLLKNQSFYNFLSNINIFKWEGRSKLQTLDFEKYIKVYLGEKAEWIKGL